MRRSELFLSCYKLLSCYVDLLLKASSTVMLAEQERDLFLQKFQKYLVSGNPRSSVDHPASADLKATTVCRNLGKVAYTFIQFCGYVYDFIHYTSCVNLFFVGFAGSLSEYARSLIPNNLLNEEDVQLLR